MPEVTQEKHRVGRPRIDGESWLEGLLADSPKSAADIIEAGEARGISERTLARIKMKLFRRLNADQEGEPWRAFRRDGHWYWGDERQMPKRNADGLALRGDGSAIIPEDSVGIISRNFSAWVL